MYKKLDNAVVKSVVKVAIYIRVSTQEQALEGYSIAAQTERLSAYCKAKNWQIFHIYIDPGFSGSNMQRPALQQLFNDVDNKRIDCVLVYKLDRLSRSQKDTLYMIEDVFLKHDISFVSMNENFDTSTPFGRAMIGILSVFAQLEREQIRERSRMGRVERAKSGLWHGGGYRPYGYDYVGGKLYVNKAEKYMIIDAFKMFLEHQPINAITDVLNKRYGKKLHESTVHSMLITPLYTGVISWRGKIYHGQHEAIIDEVTFKQAQKLMNSRTRIANSKPSPFKSTTLLGGLLYCAHCGARYFSKGNYSGHGDKKTYRPYYYCYSRGKTSLKHILDPNCKNPVYPVCELDKSIIEEIKRLSDEKYFRKIVKKNTISDNSNDRRVALMQRIDDLESQRSRLLDLYQIGSISIDDVDTRSQKIEDEQNALQGTLDAIESHKTDKLPSDKAKNLIAQFIDSIESDNLDIKKFILSELIEKIIVNETPGDIDIIWNF